MSLYSIFPTVTFFPIAIASHLFFYLLSIYAYKTAWSGILIMCYGATWNILEVLNLFKLVLVILVTLAYFLYAIFSIFSHISSYWVSSYN